MSLPDSSPMKYIVTITKDPNDFLFRYTTTVKTSEGAYRIHDVSLTYLGAKYMGRKLVKMARRPYKTPEVVAKYEL